METSVVLLPCRSLPSYDPISIQHFDKFIEEHFTCRVRASWKPAKCTSAVMPTTACTYQNPDIHEERPRGSILRFTLLIMNPDIHLAETNLTRLDAQTRGNDTCPSTHLFCSNITELTYSNEHEHNYSSTHVHASTSIAEPGGQFGVQVGQFAWHSFT